MYLPFQWLLAMQLLKNANIKSPTLSRKNSGKEPTVQPGSENSYYFWWRDNFCERFNKGDV